MSTWQKYDLLAAGFAEREYWDPVRYSARRADLIVGLEPRLGTGRSVLDLCCADGIMAAPLRARGLRYLGVDASEKMVAAARARDPEATFVCARMLEFEPQEPVDATICLRSFYLAPDRLELFRRVASYTLVRFVFDVDPSAHPVDGLVRDLRAAGFSRVELRPFLMPQKRRLPDAALALLGAVERTGPIAARLVHRVGCLFVSASV